MGSVNATFNANKRKPNTTGKRKDASELRDLLMKQVKSRFNAPKYNTVISQPLFGVGERVTVIDHLSAQADLRGGKRLCFSSKVWGYVGKVLDRAVVQSCTVAEETSRPRLLQIGVNNGAAETMSQLVTFLKEHAQTIQGIASSSKSVPSVPVLDSVPAAFILFLVFEVTADGPYFFWPVLCRVAASRA
ncbi:MAG: hypothetical protein CL798_07340 [Chromatiales bacterium]|nr:hypothetical protein [Chromatiales bacterium]